VRCNARAAFLRCGAASWVGFVGFRRQGCDGTTMSIELTRIGLTGLGDKTSGWPEKSPVKYLRSGFVWLPAALIAALGA